MPTLNQVILTDGEYLIIDDEDTVSRMNVQYCNDPSGPYMTYVRTLGGLYGCLSTQPQLYDKMELIR